MSSPYTFWSDIVSWMIEALDFVQTWVSNLFRFFMTPVWDLVQDYSPGLSGAILESVLQSLADNFGFNAYSVTFIELTLGFMLPFIMIFTIYRYLRR